ncbi:MULTISPECIES: xanthine dehydrogenase family protein subunit M [unclassified Mesorhizobium]|uniref:FAD binding domain-containing protein n=1 Tax=unclassified Mesorhizobium TaxID=325217 RepID=UPI002414FD44|nr:MULTISPECIES: xanthine dehydrogenase family protein subunit M [unclassified Mesorhizobium]MDG4890077.1 xanthine dehydrogenase family protein subunit M [Mesorhizobium sp. WSM4887]MDG4904219.1 xanthine dehydrogenase family protein subunit M [Mesorhizobium sp. WSM4962]MDG4909246.1 xanthine dehydrogenase family protein subunit M [Mesorhizobium sp. WSM4898]MDG4921870.1 xanthine dehydrogenase family protein subunit M [Mesorhizobium sp. WSM4989]
MSNLTSVPYAKPKLVSEALALIANEKACVLAGGTDLVVMRAQSVVSADSLVDIKGIEALTDVNVGGRGISIGACTSLDTLSYHKGLGLNAISDGASVVGGWQTRCRATIGGNICRASPAADTLCGLLVLGCELEVASLGGERSISADAFFKGPGRTAMRPGELLTRIVIPFDGGGSAYRRFTYRNSMDLSVAGVAIFLQLNGDRCTHARVAVGACGPTPLLVPEAASELIGSTVDSGAVAAAAAAVVAAARPIDDVRGSRKHRLHVLRPLVVSVAAEALSRARQWNKDSSS